MLMILAYYTFAKEKVDYAVIETGLGGTFDASNCVTNSDKLCVITRIGKDHTHILGKTIAEIAGNKAGIINVGQSGVYLVSGKISDNVIRHRAAAVKSEIFPLIPTENLKIENTGHAKSADFSFAGFVLTKLPVENLPKYQLENLALSLAALVLASKKHNWEILPETVYRVIENYSFPGRFEIIETPNSVIVLDGAHNPQKTQALVTSISYKFPNQKFNFIVAFKEDKDIDSMLKTLQPLAHKFFPTQFHLQSQDIKLKSADPSLIRDLLLELKFDGRIHCTESLEQALEVCGENHANLNNQTTTPNITVITGSLYLVAEFKNQILAS